MRRRCVQDWSNAKEMWANPQKWGGGLAADGKMDCEERLLEQAKMTKAHAKSLGIDQKVWVYRNLVKALPWYSSVRKLLNDPRYSDFFLHFDDVHTRRRRHERAKVTLGEAKLEIAPVVATIGADESVIREEREFQKVVAAV